MIPLISIIIVNWNGKKYIGGCLSSVTNGRYKNLNIIVIDNGSTDGSIEFVKNNYPDIEIVALKENCGFAKANNIGIRRALKKDGDFIVLLNNDIEIKPDFLVELVKAAGSGDRIGACQPKVLSLTRPDILDAVGMSIGKNGGAIQIGHGEKDIGQYNRTMEIFGACAAAALYRKSMFEEIGLFDEDFFAYFEDVDLALRVKRAGWKCVYVPTAIAYHRHSATLGRDSDLKKYLLERNKYYYIIKNFSNSYVIMTMLRQLVGIAKMMLRYIKGRDRSLNSVLLKANFDAIKNTPKMLIKRLKNKQSCYRIRKRIGQIARKKVKAEREKRI